MALKEKLTEEDLALVDVLEDPIFLAEFLRSTRDGSMNKAIWPSKEFEYRHYQRALVSDQSEKIVLLGGRAIGKCQPTRARVYTTKGFQKIYYLRQKPVFEVYCLDDTGKITTRRAVLQKDMLTRTYAVTTESGYTTYATEIHPFLTNKGYVQLKDLMVNDLVAVSTHLPWESNQKLWRWHELRLFGYLFLAHNWRLDKDLYPSRTAIKKELRKIAELSDLRYMETDNIVRLLRRKNGNRSLLTQIAKELDFEYGHKFVGVAKDFPRYIPETLMAECLEHNKIFLEAIFSQYAELSRRSVTLDCKHIDAANDIRELLLRFGIESVLENTVLSLRDDRAIYRFFTIFNLVGVSVENIAMPAQSFDIAPHMRYEPITSIEIYKDPEITYSIYVYDYHNYISDYIYVHNSLVLEDKHIYDVINQDLQYPETKEMLLATNNQAQLEPIQGRLIDRFRASPLLREFLVGINKSSGVFDFQFGDIQFKLRTRIAGTTGAQNMIGMHIPQINIDESQLFTLQAWTQLSPAYNDWEKRTQVFIAGVSNGLRNSLLYSADRKFATWKRYRIPSHNNPYYKQETDLENIKRYGGEDSDDYQQLVLARHGQAAFTVITRDQIRQESYSFYSYKYTGADIAKGTHFENVLDRPNLTEYTMLTAGIDCGFVDPTVITVVGLNSKGIWLTLARYTLTRVDMATQEKIVDWLDKQYHFDKMGIDIGSGGGGTQLLHSLLFRPEYAPRKYDSRIVPVQFGERVQVGFNSDGKELTQTTKTLGASLLIQLIQQGHLVLSEVDHVAVSELERITKTKSANGDDRYFILSEKGNGASPSDHIFASYICWAIATRDMSFQKPRRKRLGKSNGGF